MAPIAVGDTIPDGKLSFLNEDDKFETVSIYSLITGKKVLILGVPGVFIPSSSWCLRPKINRVAFKSRKYHRTLYITVNDPYVAQIWEHLFFPVDMPHIKILTDSKAAYFASLGLQLDLTSEGFGVRCKRFTMIVDDRKVVHLAESQIVLQPRISPLEIPTPNVSRAPIAVGDIIPDGTLTFIDDPRQIETVSVRSIVTRKKKVIVLGVRGAFSRSCSDLVDSFIEKADDFKTSGVQEILCISVNDPYVMWGWKKVYFKSKTDIKFLADSTAAYVASLGLVDDLSHTEYGIRSKRFALLLENRRVKAVRVHRPGYSMFTAEDMLVAMDEAEATGMEICLCGFGNCIMLNASLNRFKL